MAGRLTLRIHKMPRFTYSFTADVTSILSKVIGRIEISLTADPDYHSLYRQALDCHEVRKARPFSSSARFEKCALMELDFCSHALFEQLSAVVTFQILRTKAQHT